MTQEEKELLIKDLCGRLPYGTMVYAQNAVDWYDSEICTQVLSDVINEDYIVKPYLFPLSSMTDEQCKTIRNLIYENFSLDDEFSEGIQFKTYGDILVWFDEKPINDCYFIFDWLNKNHFDYRGLIPKGLAIDATGLNIY